MIGGLFGTTGRRAIIAAAGLLASGVAAQAADLGGNCCADLEERVAELEATTARKGNRKVSLTVSGHVNEAVIFWDDGVESNAYVVSNNSARSRFRFVGDAKINADWSAGYLMEIGVRYANSGSRNQTTPGGGSNANQIDIRHSAWWIDSKQLGRLWVGKTSSATDGIAEIELANINSVGSDPSAWNGGFFLRRSDNGLLAGSNGATNPSANLRWNNVTPSFNGAWNAGEGDRNTVVKYVSPTVAGFIFSAAWGEDDFWDVALRYAGEFGGFRLAAGVGYKQHSDNVGKTGSDGILCADLGNANNLASAVDCNALAVSGSIMHVASGIFVTGSWGRIEDKNRNALYAAPASVGGAASPFAVRDRDDHWRIEAGIEQKWTPLGLTTIYGEYAQYHTGAGLVGAGAANNSFTATNIGGLGFLSQSDVTIWGFGLNQQVTAAAMDIYISYRHFDIDAKSSATGSSVGEIALPLKNFDAVMTGAIIRF